MSQKDMAKAVEHAPIDRFENAIREIGISTACEWFGHAPDSEFTRETIKVLNDRLAECMERGK